MFKRLSPEQLLAKYETKLQHGKLTIFLGAAAGVGKTYSMLKAIPELIDDKVDVVIGYIETHDRAETKAVMPLNVEIIPLKETQHKGHKLYELDVDAILARHPHLVIIDELAHTNVMGSRNTKRYQDVLEILAAGIDVYTAVNIQHIESLNDVVGQIVGIKIKETIPDSVIDEAHEVKLIDVTPDELIERLSEGKIYARERVTNALDNFFRKGNLTALREMALINTARKVEQQVKQYRNDNAIDNVWASHENLMVVIEPGYSSEKIVRSGKTMFNKGFRKWFVAYIDNSEFANRSLHDHEKLLELLDLARELGAQTMPLIGNNLAESIINCARENNINTIVLSQYRLSLYYRLFGTTLITKLAELAPEINLHLINDEFTEKGNDVYLYHKPERHLNYPKILRKIAYNAVLFALLGVIMLPLSGRVANANILMLYLLAIIISSRGRGILSAIIAALLATISFDFFFVPPQFSFAVADLQYLTTFVVMATVGSAFSIVNGNLRYQISALRKAQRQARLLYDISHKFAQAMIEQQVIDSVAEYLPQLLDAKYAFLTHTLEEVLCVNANQLGDVLDLTISRWVFDNIQNAGLNTSTFASSKAYYVPLHSQIRARGVLAFVPNDHINFFLPHNQELLANFTGVLATTLERIHFTQIAIKTEVLLAKQNP